MYSKTNYFKALESRQHQTEFGADSTLERQIKMGKICKFVAFYLYTLPNPPNLSGKSHSLAVLSVRRQKWRPAKYPVS